MEKQLTIAEALKLFIPIIIILIGWGISVEVRFAEYKIMMDSVLEMKTQVTAIHDKVLILDFQQNGITTRGSVINKTKDEH